MNRVQGEHTSPEMEGNHMIDTVESDYYRLNLERTQHFFHILEKHYDSILAGRFGAEQAERLVREVKRLYPVVVKRLPYIGSDENYLTQALVGTVPALTLFHVLKTLDEIDRPARDAGSIYLEAISRAFGNNEMGSPEELRERGAVMFTDEVSVGMRSMADRSQEKRYEGDFVYSYVPGDGAEFDFGLDFTECAVCKFFEKEGATELTPYMCQYDFIESRFCHTGLSRTMTLADGHDRCDFRYKRGQT